MQFPVCITLYKQYFENDISKYSSEKPKTIYNKGFGCVNKLTREFTQALYKQKKFPQNIFICVLNE